jgi:hypothetical protein
MTDSAFFSPSDSQPGTATEADRWTAWAIATAALCTVAAALLVLLAPSLRPALLKEDAFIETATALVLLAVVAGSAIAYAWRGPRPALMIAGLIGLVGLLDETSFGARLFGFTPPALYGGGELDGFHDLLILAYRLLGVLHPALGAVLLGLVLAASAASLLFAFGLMTRQSPGRIALLADHRLLFIYIGLIGLAQVIDIATTSSAFSAMEEMIELDAALVLAFYVAQQGVAAGRRPFRPQSLGRSRAIRPRASPSDPG